MKSLREPYSLVNNFDNFSMTPQHTPLLQICHCISQCTLWFTFCSITVMEIHHWKAYVQNFFLIAIFFAFSNRSVIFSFYVFLIPVTDIPSCHASFTPNTLETSLNPFKLKCLLWSLPIAYLYWLLVCEIYYFSFALTSSCSGDCSQLLLLSYIYFHFPCFTLFLCIWQFSMTQ